MTTLTVPSTAQALSTLHLTVGGLDYTSCRLLRNALQLGAAEPGTSLVVDLRRLDDAHEMTLFALLSERARLTGPGRLAVLHSSPRLTTLLAAVGIPVEHTDLGGADAPRRTEHIGT